MNLPLIRLVPRFLRLVLGDMRFQFRYGFYALYALISTVYIIILSLFPVSMREQFVSLIIFTDPSVLGLIFMGAVVLLEKSERVLASLAVSPVLPVEYVVSKALSFSVVSTLSGLTITLGGGQKHLLPAVTGVFFGSLFFSLIGICLAGKVRSLNHFIIVIMPGLLFFMIPPLVETVGWYTPFFSFHAGVVLLRLISGNLAVSDFLFPNGLLPNLAVFAVWFAVVFLFACRSTAKLFVETEEIAL